MNPICAIYYKFLQTKFLHMILLAQEAYQWLSPLLAKPISTDIKDKIIKLKDKILRLMT